MYLIMVSYNLGVENEYVNIQTQINIFSLALFYGSRVIQL